jgi:hypothetical protein
MQEIFEIADTSPACFGIIEKAVLPLIWDPDLDFFNL